MHQDRRLVVFKIMNFAGKGNPTSGVINQALRVRVALAAALLAAILPLSTAAQGQHRMTQVAKGTLQVEMKPQSETGTQDGNSKLGRRSLDKVFQGDLVAVGKGEMLTALTQTKGSAGYVAIERVTGTLHGRKGSFVLQHSGSMSRGVQNLSISVVPDSGTEELEGILGAFKLDVVDGKHFYEFEYSLPR